MLLYILLQLLYIYISLDSIAYISYSPYSRPHLHGVLRLRHMLGAHHGAHRQHHIEGHTAQVQQRRHRSERHAKRGDHCHISNYNDIYTYYIYANHAYIYYYITSSSTYI